MWPRIHTKLRVTQLGSWQPTGYAATQRSLLHVQGASGWSTALRPQPDAVTGGASREPDARARTFDGASCPDCPAGVFLRLYV